MTEILKVANDVTQRHQESQRQKAVLKALNDSMAVIEFTPQGEILEANKNFEAAMGYQQKDIIGQHHRMFCPPDFYRNNPDFWERLAQGDFTKGRFERITKNGQSIWLARISHEGIKRSG